MAVNLIQGKQIATASWSQNAVTASYATSASYTATSSYAPNYVPYTGATQNVDLGLNNLKTVGIEYVGSDIQNNITLGGNTPLTLSSTDAINNLSNQIEINPEYTFSRRYIQAPGFIGDYLQATSITGSLLGTASFAISSSRAVTASYALNGGVTQLLAGPNITLSPTNGLGQVTVTAAGGGGGSFNTATGSYGSFYDTTTQTNPVANIPRSMSLNTTDITNGVSVSGSTNPFNTYIKTENAGVYNIQFSAQLDKTDSGADEIVIWLRKNGINLTDTATTITLTGNNGKQVAAWNWFVNSAANDYYQIIWQSADTNVRLLAEPQDGHPGIPSVIVTANRVDQFLSNTGSFSGSFTGQFTGSLFGTASFAVSSSFATTSSIASTLQGLYSIKITSSSSAVTGTVAETQVLKVEIPANSLTLNEIINMPLLIMSKTGTAGTCEIRVKISTSSTMPSGNTDAIARYSSGASNLFAKIQRDFIIDNGTIKVYPLSSNLIDNTTSTVTILTKAFDPTIVNYLYVSLQQSASGDSSVLQGFYLTN